MSRAMRREGFDYMTLDDFEELLADKPDHEKWELIGGRLVRLMVGARWEHHFIVRNITFEFTGRLRNAMSSCDVFSETFWLKERFMDLAVFPDVMVRCGPRLDPNLIAINDPVVLVEVTGPGSASRDRVEKDILYRQLPSLQHYVIVERDVARVDVTDRHGESWALRRAEGLDETVALPALGIELPLGGIYRKVLSDAPG
jgi:Uma2 family endonuclease